MKFISLSLLMMISMNVFATEICEEDPNVGGGGGGTAEKIVKYVEGQECPNKEKLKNICMMIGNRMKDPNPTEEIKYRYQRSLIEASCAKANDSREVKEKKIRTMWIKLQDELICNSVQFDVLDGSVLKYAVIKNFEDFLNDAANMKLDLNKIDKSDGRTVLDYLKYQIERNKGNELENMYQRYYDKLSKAGAKHKSEL